MTKKAPKYKYLTAGMNGYEFDKNFWRKNAKVVEIDACEIIDRLFYCSLTCQLPFQVSNISFHENYDFKNKYLKLISRKI